MPRLRPTPWLLLYEVATVAHGVWRDLPSGDRQKLSRLAMKSRGLPANLTARERAEVKRILAKIDLKTVAREVLPKAVARRRMR
ncbi:MAG: hypothetical protein QOF77_1374 [Solirubrobacteraceae bacterium]|nr:hypothetical protein [Solirubrobacteraceae bacterium]